VPREACLGPGHSQRLSGFDRDRMLAAIYRRAFADRVDSTVCCAACASRFDLHFSLAELEATLDAQRRASGCALGEDGDVRTNDGALFRLPTGQDECEAAALPAPQARAALAATLVAPASRPIPAGELDDLLERVAPLFDLHLDARCPECGHAQQVRFSLQAYLLDSLVNERRRLVAEVHRLAIAYRWNRQDILALPRAVRRQHVELIETEHSLRSRGRMLA
jgi:hypothetical protein